MFVYTYLLRTQYLWWFMWVIRVDVECKLELTAFVHPCTSVYVMHSVRVRWSMSTRRDWGAGRGSDIPSSGVKVRLNDKTFVGSGNSIFIVFGSSSSVKSSRQYGWTCWAVSLDSSWVELYRQTSGNWAETDRKGTYPSELVIEQPTFSVSPYSLPLHLSWLTRSVISYHPTLREERESTLIIVDNVY